MKKFVVFMFAITASVSSFAKTFVYHETCEVKNNTMSIVDKDGNFTKNSPEAILASKGYVVVYSSDPNDKMADLIQLNLSNSINDHYAVTVELLFQSNTVYEGAGNTVEEAIQDLPNCRTK